LSDRLASVIIVSGPSGAGKSSLVAQVLAEMDGLRFSVSHSTRPPRPGEQDGVEYHFVSRSEFERLIEGGAFLEWAEVHGERYGTSRSEYERARRDGVDLLLDLDVQGAQNLRRTLRDAVTVFVMPPSFASLESRLRARGEDERALQRRLETATREMKLHPDYEYAIINEQLGRSVEELKAIIRAARCRSSRRAAATQAVLDTFPTAKET
jgi:guanylate kinase